MRFRYCVMLLMLFFLTCQSDSDLIDPFDDSGSPLNDSRVQDVYSWFEQNQLDNGLLESAEDSNVVSLYDNALSALVFSIMGDYNRAEAIFDFFVGKLNSEFKESPGGFAQFRDQNGNYPAEGAHRWMGDNGWLLLAINNYHYLAQNNNYITLANEIEQWLRSLQDTDGGLWGGYDKDDQQIDKITEGMIDSFNAVPGYDTFHSNILNYFQNECWDTMDKMLISWPDPPHPNYKYATDMISWGYCAIEDFPDSVLDQSSILLNTQQAAVNNRWVEGFCIDMDLDHVWLEGTGQIVVAFNTGNRISSAIKYLGEMEKVLIESSKYANAKGFPYVTNMGTFIADDEFWEGADTNIVVSSGAWYLFGKLKFDPFAIGRDKGISVSDKFWLD